MRAVSTLTREIVRNAPSARQFKAVIRAAVDAQLPIMFADPALYRSRHRPGWRSARRGYGRR